jgi:hypothetical protein
MAVEELIGKAQLRSSKQILLAQNLQNNIAISRKDMKLNRAKVTLMMHGEWDQRASGKAYNSTSERQVSQLGGEQERFVV